MAAIRHILSLLLEFWIDNICVNNSVDISPVRPLAYHSRGHDSPQQNSTRVAWSL